MKLEHDFFCSVNAPWLLADTSLSHDRDEYIKELMKDIYGVTSYLILTERNSAKTVSYRLDKEEPTIVRVPFLTDFSNAEVRPLAYELKGSGPWAHTPYVTLDLAENKVGSYGVPVHASITGFVFGNGNDLILQEWMLKLETLVGRHYGTLRRFEEE